MPTLGVHRWRSESKPQSLQRSAVAERDQLIEHSWGNLLALKIVATSIRNLFNGDIAKFLEQKTIVFNGLRRSLDEHLVKTLSPEKEGRLP